MRKTAAMQLVEIRQGGNLEDLLLHELNAGRTYAQISERWQVSEPTIARWIEEFGFKRCWQREAVAA